MQGSLEAWRRTFHQLNRCSSYTPNMEDAMMAICQCRGHCVWSSGLEGIDSCVSTCVIFLIDQKRSMHWQIAIIQPLLKQNWNFESPFRKGDSNASSLVRSCCIPSPSHRHKARGTRIIARTTFRSHRLKVSIARIQQSEQHSPLSLSTTSRQSWKV
jgi:hypothetical protein